MANGFGSPVLYCLLIACTVGYVENVNVAAGEKYKFLSKAQTGFDSFDWKHNGNLVVEIVRGGDLRWYRYKNRGEINMDTGDFTLLMEQGDDGEFIGQFEYTGGDLRYSPTYVINVMDPVSVPEVTCTTNDTDRILLCSVDSPVKANFSWAGPHQFHQSGNRLYITGQQSDDSVYFCTAQNEVSKKTSADFTLKNCPKDESNVGVVVGAIIGAILALVGVLFAVIFREKIKAWVTAHAGGNAGETGSPVVTDGKQNGQEATIPLNQDGKSTQG